jgi:TPR repeat protein
MLFQQARSQAIVFLMVKEIDVVEKTFKEAKTALKKQDHQAAMKILRPLADQGDADAQYYLGWINSYGGRNVKPDYLEAMNWYRKAADQGYAEAHIMIASMYRGGIGVKVDPHEALKWYRKAAELGEAGGQAALASLYERGELLKKDEAEAAKWLLKAAEQDTSRDTHFKMGRFYEEGKGVERDPVEAYFWYSMAAFVKRTKKYELYTRRLASKLNKQQMASVKKRVHQWWQRAADQGNVEAQILFGRLYEEGIEVEQDYKETYFWYSLAAIVKNEKRHTKFTQRVAAHLSKEQINAVDKRVTEWKMTPPPRRKRRRLT